MKTSSNYYRTINNTVQPMMCSSHIFTHTTNVTNDTKCVCSTVLQVSFKIAAKLGDSNATNPLLWQNKRAAVHPITKPKKKRNSVLLSCNGCQRICKEKDKRNDLSYKKKSDAKQVEVLIDNILHGDGDF